MVIPKMANRRATKRILKPVIEKKRRDRINQRLDELRKLLLDNTLDTRLQNPKLEKAEILELTVEYIKKKAKDSRESQGDSNKNSDRHDANTPTLLSGRLHVPFASFHEPVNAQKQIPSNPIYKAGFKECVSRLASFIECVEASQRDGFIQGLCHHLDSYSSALPQARIPAQTAHHTWIPSAELTCRLDLPAMGPTRVNNESFSYTSLYPNSFMLHHPHPTGQSMTHPYLSPPYSNSPPPSPCYSSSTPPFSSSPTYLSVPCHFHFPPTISPLSTDSSSSSSSLSISPPAAAVVPGPHLQASFGSPKHVLPTGSVPPCQPRTLRRALFQNQTHSVWRPW